MEYKTVSFNITECKQLAEDGGKIGTIKGFASTFGNVDRTNDIISKGAFDETIKKFKESGRPIRMLFNHKSLDFPIGGFPPELVKITDEGLEVVGKIDTNTSRGHDAFSLAKNGFLSDFSVGFSIPKGSTEIKGGNRIINDIDLWEISLVSEPANTKAQVTEVKTVVPFQDLPIAVNESGELSTTEWDVGEAFDRVRAFTEAGEGQDFEAFAKAFFWFESEDPENIESYRLQFADIVDGEIVAIPNGIFEVVSRIKNDPDALGISEEDIKEVENNISRYYDKMALPNPFGDEDALEETEDGILEEDISEESSSVSFVDRIKSLKGAEEFLRNPRPLSRKERKAFISLVKNSKQRDAVSASPDVFDSRDAISRIDDLLIEQKLSNIIKQIRS